MKEEIKEPVMGTNIYDVLDQLQELIARTEHFQTRQDLVRMYNDLLLKI